MADLATRERAARQIHEIKAMLPAYNTTPRAAPHSFPGDNQTEAVVEGGWFGGIPGPRFWHRAGGGSGGPVWGVTDGSNAQPGEVGEWLNLATIVSFTTAAVQVQFVSIGVLPPGDWDVWAWAYIATPMTGMNIALVPIPAGFSSGMQGFLIQAGDVAQDVLLTPHVRALTSAPSLLTFEVVTNQGGAGPAPGTFPLYCSARRMR